VDDVVTKDMFMVIQVEKNRKPHADSGEIVLLIEIRILHFDGF
jgi:hypothetical protein